MKKSKRKDLKKVLRFQKTKKEKGITLIALVITIIVLLILAGVTIATLMGDNGILTRATEAKSDQDDATVVEAISLAWNEYQIIINESTGEVTESETKIASTTQVKIPGEEENYLASPTMSFLDFLKDDERGYIDENGVINVEALTGETLSKGNGTDGATDVYKMEESEDSYTLKYYGDNSDEETILWEVNNSVYPQATSEEKFYTSTAENEDEIIITGIDYSSYEKFYEVFYDSGTGNYYLETGEIIGRNPDKYFYMLAFGEETTDIVIPKTIDNKKVVSLQSGEAFFSNSNIRTITIPYSVKEISSNMFRNTPLLTTISFPEGKNPELEITADKWGADASVQIIGENGDVLE